MREFFLRQLKPSTQLFFLLTLAMLSFGICIEFALALVERLYGFNLLENPNALTDFSDPLVIGAQKVLLLFQHIGLFVLPALLFNQLFSFGNREAFIRWGDHKRLVKMAMACILMLAALPFINSLLALNASLKLPEALAGLEQKIKSMEASAATLTEVFVKADTTTMFLFNLFLMAILPAIGEEFIFRGILQKLFARITQNAHWGIWISATLFSALHFQFYGFLPRMLLGAMFGYVFMFTGSIWPAVIAHFTNNASALIIAFGIDKKVFPANLDMLGSSLSDWPIVLVSLLIGFVLFRQFKKQSVYGTYKQAFLFYPKPNQHLENPEEE